MAHDAPPPARRPSIRPGEVVLVCFIASLFVIIEARTHALALLDDSMLNLARLSRWLGDPEIAAPPDRRTPAALQCRRARGRHAVVLLPPGPLEPAPATGDARDTLWFHTLQWVREAGPRVIALDLDPSLTGLPADAVVDALKPRPHETARTALALVALPPPGDDAAVRARRRTRNDWLHRLCEAGAQADVPVALATPAVDVSESFNAAVQYHGARVPEAGPELPPVYPALGQVARLLADRTDARDTELGPGALCAYLREVHGGEAIPFVDRTDGLLPGHGPTLAAAQRGREQLFVAEWLNPWRVQRDIPLLHVDGPADLDVLSDQRAACLAGRLVFIGQAPPGRGIDEFPTLASPRTPGVFVHAMVARSGETGLRTALSLNALVDFLVGYLLTALGQRIARPQWAHHDSFTLRLGAQAGRLLVPLAVAGGVLLLAALSLAIGVFLNPLVVLMGMWLHVVLEPFLHDEATDAPDAGATAGAAPAAAPGGSRWRELPRRLLARPRMAAGGRLRSADLVLHGVTLCVTITVIAYAAWLVALRIYIQWR